MNIYREKLVDKMIQIYGYEHPLVIAFARMCETCAEDTYVDTLLETLVKVYTEK